MKMGKIPMDEDGEELADIVAVEPLKEEIPDLMREKGVEWYFKDK